MISLDRRSALATQRNGAPPTSAVCCARAAHGGDLKRSPYCECGERCERPVSWSPPPVAKPRPFSRQRTPAGQRVRAFSTCCVIAPRRARTGPKVGLPTPAGEFGCRGCVAVRLLILQPPDPWPHTAESWTRRLRARADIDALVFARVIVISAAYVAYAPCLRSSARTGEQALGRPRDAHAAVRPVAFHRRSSSRWS